MQLDRDRHIFSNRLVVLRCVEMSTGYAPPTIPSVEVGTPPREWSESRLPGNADEKSREESQVLKELEKRQAQPREESEQTRDHPSIGAAVVQPAKQYVPQQVEETIEYATQAAAAAVSYLPIPQGIKDTVASYLSSEKKKEEPHVSLPSTELKGAQPSERTGGVGALPGNLSESSVALLPDERQERAQERRPASPRQRRGTMKPPAAGGEHRESRKEEEAKIPRDPALSKDSVTYQLPDVPPKSTEARAAETIESNIGARYGPEDESQKEVTETKSQEPLSKQEKTAAVSDIGADEIRPWCCRTE
ncbi:hypothetical protein J3R82DRAFT_8972 [Butyriboletus roseoflavus]|nr:hypothetical protein J3R82DRAFT_8972 [Butyriboletus roseoflavus]